MISRRTFLMATFCAAAVGGVAIVTTQLGRGKTTRQQTGQAAVQEVHPAAGLPTRQPTVNGAAAQDGPVVLIPRSQWGAAAPAVSPDGTGEHGPYNTITNPDGWLVYDQPLADVLNTIIIHHSALPLTDGPLAIQKLHMEEKGFADVGYQYLIDAAGKLYEGRALNVRGAHTYGANYGSVGICMIGNFEEIQPAPVQVNTLKALISALVQQYAQITHLAGHRDFNPGKTLCPGKNLYPMLPGLAEDHQLRYGI